MAFRLFHRAAGRGGYGSSSSAGIAAAVQRTNLHGINSSCWISALTPCTVLREEIRVYFVNVR